MLLCTDTASIDVNMNPCNEPGLPVKKNIVMKPSRGGREIHNAHFANDQPKVVNLTINTYGCVPVIALERQSYYYTRHSVSAILGHMVS